jgi:hypothetical protein
MTGPAPLRGRTPGEGRSRSLTRGEGRWGELACLDGVADEGEARFPTCRGHRVLVHNLNDAVPSCKDAFATGTIPVQTGLDQGRNRSRARRRVVLLHLAGPMLKVATKED